jgi:hypothetical protein
MFFEHDGERVSILVAGRAHTQSVLAVVRMERSGRTLTALACSFPSATVRALSRLSEVFCDQGRPPLSGEEEERVLAEVKSEAPVDPRTTIPVLLPILPTEGAGDDADRRRDESAEASPRRAGKIARATSILRRRARWLMSRAGGNGRADGESTYPSSGTQEPARVATVTQLLPPPLSGSGAALDEAVVMEIEFSGFRVRVPERVDPHYVAALVAALASRH